MSRDLDLLVELNQSRQLPLDEEWSLKDSLRNEEIYLKLIDGYASNKEFLNESVTLIEAESIFKDIKLEICFIVFNCDDTSLIQKILKLVCSGSINLPLNEKIALLEEEKQKSIINQLLSINSKKSLSYAGKCIIARGYKEFAGAFYSNNYISQTDDPSVAYSVLCRLGTETEIKLVQSAFVETRHPILKELMALELAFTHFQPAISYLKEFHSIESFQISPFICSKAESALYKNKLTKEARQANQEKLYGFLEEFAGAMILYGNPELISFFIERLEDRNLCLTLHEIILRFFDEDESAIQEGHKIIENWGDFEEELEDKFIDYNEDDYSKRYAAIFNQEAIKVQSKIINFWNNNKSYIDSKINTNQRYYYSSPYSISELWYDTFHEGAKEQIILVHKGIQLLTNKNFSFDPCALVSKQIQQNKKIMLSLNEDREKYPSGAWLSNK